MRTINLPACFQSHSNCLPLVHKKNYSKICIVIDDTTFSFYCNFFRSLKIAIHSQSRRGGYMGIEANCFQPDLAVLLGGGCNIIFLQKFNEAFIIFTIISSCSGFPNNWFLSSSTPLKILLIGLLPLDLDFSKSFSVAFCLSYNVSSA